MDARTPPLRTTAELSHSGWFSSDTCDLDDFRVVVEQTTDPADYPYADRVEQNIVVYSADLTSQAADPNTRRAVQAELAQALHAGPGVLAFSGAFDAAVVDAATATFERLITEQKASGSVAGDHFASPGTNDRVWSALDKLAVSAPETFAAYYANDLLALVCEAWLGPHYQVTSQVNVVNPGGQAQVAHRDYHLGFMDRAQAEDYPAHVHLLSAILTLQGAVAHCDMPLESGPTLYLPHSQKYAPGYVAYHDPVFTQYFEERHVQLPLRKGDAVFFNPALFHGAGTNRTANIRRMANLLQVSSAFGRAMESVDTTAITLAVYPVLRRWKADGAPSRALANVITAAAEGYPFPTSLDRDQPVGSLAPQSQAALVTQALAEDWDVARLTEALHVQRARRASPVA